MKLTIFGPDLLLHLHLGCRSTVLVLHLHLHLGGTPTVLILQLHLHLHLHLGGRPNVLLLHLHLHLGGSPNVLILAVADEEPRVENKPNLGIHASVNPPYNADANP